MDRDGKNLHQGQAIGNDLLTDTEKECISLLIFFDFHNHFIANLRKVLQYSRGTKRHTDARNRGVFLWTISYPIFCG